MKITVHPSACSGTLSISPAKNLTQRCLIAAALAPGVTTLHNLYLSNDPLELLQLLGKLNVDFQLKSSKLLIDGSESLKRVNGPLTISNSIASWRLLLPLLSLTKEKVTINIDQKLVKKSLAVYRKIWKQQDLLWDLQKNNLTIKGDLKAGKYVITDSTAAQFISGLLFSLPLLPGNSTLRFPKELSSNDNINLTLRILKEFGIEITKAADDRFIIPGPQSYRNPQETYLESDYFLAAHFCTLAAINAPLSLVNLPEQTDQVTARIIPILSDKAADIFIDKNRITITPTALSGSKIDLDSAFNLAFLAGVLAACSKQETSLVNLLISQYSETDSLALFRRELSHLGISTKLVKNTLTVKPWQKKPTKPLHLESYGDYRIAMALIILATIAPVPITINGCQVVKKVYPSFFDDLRIVNIKFDITS